MYPITITFHVIVMLFLAAISWLVLASGYCAAQQCTSRTPIMVEGRNILQPFNALLSPKDILRPVEENSLEIGIVSFRARDLTTALTIVNDLLRTSPGNAHLLQFRSLVYFAMGNYRSASVDIREAVFLGKLWTVDVLAKLYETADVYGKDVSALRAVIDAGGGTLLVSTEPLFLLAYHQVVTGNYEVARDTLQQLLALQPNDRVARALLSTIETKLAQQVSFHTSGTASN